MRAVIYARYSSDQQRATSIDDQIRLCKEKIAREGWTLVQVYRDAAMSGATALRPGYQAMLAGRSRGGIRCRGRRGARSPLPRSGGYRRAVQAPAIRRHPARDPRRGRDRRPAYRAQGHDERALPQGPRGQDPAGSSRPRRGRQVGRRQRLWLRPRQRLRPERRAGSRRPDDQRRRGRDRARDLLPLCGRRGAAQDRLRPQRPTHSRPARRRLEREHAERQSQLAARGS